MSEVIDITGHRFGRLVAISYVNPKRWLCRCDCGTETIIPGDNLRRAITKSCGCLRTEVTRSRSYKHGHNIRGHRSSSYRSWANMIERCTNPHDTDWKNYGGRGIAVCDRWRHSFEAFLEDMGEKPPGHSIDRINNDGNYEPGNCRWATASEQQHNKRVKAP